MLLNDDDDGGGDVSALPSSSPAGMDHCLVVDGPGDLLRLAAELFEPVSLSY